jgi:hypothetical protein
MKANELCPPPHLEAADLGEENGDSLELTISKVGFDEVGEEKVTKGVVYFEEFSRGLVLNRTNGKRIIAQLGNETDDWTGKRITLYRSETDFAGKTVPCIRVKDR